jgi:hypothetical protein
MMAERLTIRTFWQMTDPLRLMLKYWRPPISRRLIEQGWPDRITFSDWEGTAFTGTSVIAMLLARSRQVAYLEVLDIRAPLAIPVDPLELQLCSS